MPGIETENDGQKAITPDGITILKEMDDGTIEIEARITDWTILDSDGECFDPEGADKGLERYRANPILTYYHESFGVKNAGMGIGELAVDAAGVVGRWRVFDTELSRMIKNDEIRGVSGGFRPLEGARQWKSSTVTLNDKEGRMLHDWELDHVAVVPVPANPRAILRMIKAASLEGMKEKTISPMHRASPDTVTPPASEPAALPEQNKEDKALTDTTENPDQLAAIIKRMEALEAENAKLKAAVEAPARQTTEPATTEKAQKPYPTLVRGETLANVKSLKGFYFDRLKTAEKPTLFRS